MKPVQIKRRVILWRSKHVDDMVWQQVFNLLWIKVDDVIIYRVRHRIEVWKEFK